MGVIDRINHSLNMLILFGKAIACLYIFNNLNAKQAFFNGIGHTGFAHERIKIHKKTNSLVLLILILIDLDASKQSTSTIGIGVPIRLTIGG